MNCDNCGKECKTEDRLNRDGHVFCCGKCWATFIKKQKEKRGYEFIFAFDPQIKRRVAYAVYDNGIAVSMVTGHKFKYTKPKKNGSKKQKT